MKDRVVITGIGAVTPIGIGREKFWKNALIGTSGIRKITVFSTDEFDIHHGGEVVDFDSKSCEAKLPGLGRAAQLAVVATEEAVVDAGWKEEELARLNPGVVMGTTMGESQTIEAIDALWLQGESFVPSGLIEKYPCYSIAHAISAFYALSNISLTIPMACAAGNYSIGYAYDLIQSGKADVMIAGGADGLSRIAFTGFNRMFAVAPDCCRPFDKNRRGMIVSEGAATLILERREHALKRGAKIYAEILGYGVSCDAFHAVAPSSDGIVRAMSKALEAAGITSEDVDYISAHGTGTPANDRAEGQAILKIMANNKHYCVSSLKSMLGHTMGAASAIEAVACALSIRDQVVTPTINFETIDPEIEIDCVPNHARKAKIDIAMNNSFAFGGNNSVLVLKKESRRNG